MKTRFTLATIFAVVITTSSTARLNAQISISPDPTTTPSMTSDITVNNGDGTSASDYAAISGNNTNPDPRSGIFQVGYVNLGDEATKEWSLEAFGFNAATQSLTYVGGFNPTAPINDSGTNYSLGDIFLSPGNTPIPQTGLGVSVDGSNTPYTNPGYSYAIHFTGTSATSLSYTIYQLTNTTQVLTVGGQPGVNDNNSNNNGNSDPYALNLAYDLAQNNITAIATGDSTVSADTNTQVNSLLRESLFTVDNSNSDNYVASFNLSSILSDLPGGFNASLTEQCGNDLLAGSASGFDLSATPEPRSIYLALAATGLFFYIFRFLKLSRRDLQA